MALFADIVFPVLIVFAIFAAVSAVTDKDVDGY